MLKDEVRHREFGWTLLTYLLEQPAADLVRELLDRELADMFVRMRRSYAPVGGEAKTEIPEADRAWGLMPIARYADILERTFANLIVQGMIICVWPMLFVTRWLDRLPRDQIHVIRFEDYALDPNQYISTHVLPFLGKGKLWQHLIDRLLCLLSLFYQY